MKSILNIFKGKDGKDKNNDKRRVQFDRRIQVCKNSDPIKLHQPQHQQYHHHQKQQQQHQQQKKAAPIFRDDMFLGKTSGYNTPAQPRTRKPLESCPGNIALNSSPSTNSEIGENDENAPEQQTSFSSENEIDYYARYKHYKKLSRALSHQNYLLQLRLVQIENPTSSSNAMNLLDSEELKRLRHENTELRSRYNQLTIDIERSLSYQKPMYYPPTHLLQPQHHHLRPSLSMYPPPSHHQQHHPQQQGYPGFNPRPYPSSTTTNYANYSPTPTFDIPRNFSANGQFDPSETDNTDQGDHEKNIFGNSIPKVASLTSTHHPTPEKSDDDI